MLFTTYYIEGIVLCICFLLQESSQPPFAPLKVVFELEVRYTPNKWFQINLYHYSMWMFRSLPYSIQTFGRQIAKVKWDRLTKCWFFFFSCVYITLPMYSLCLPWIETKYKIFRIYYHKSHLHTENQLNPINLNGFCEKAFNENCNIYNAKKKQDVLPLKIQL